MSDSMKVLKVEKPGPAILMTSASAPHRHTWVIGGVCSLPPGSTHSDLDAVLHEEDISESDLVFDPPETEIVFRADFGPVTG